MWQQMSQLFQDDPNDGDLSNRNALQKMAVYAAQYLQGYDWVPVFNAAAQGWLIFAKRR